MSVLPDVLHANSSYAASFGDRANLALPPARRFAILTCMDARLDPAKYAGLAEGDAHVIRNAGGRASDDAIRSLVISYKLLGTQEWFVIHHTDCGMEGELNRSSQHFMTMEVCGGATAAVGGQGSSPGDAVAGAAGPGSSCGARVLASDRAGQEHRGRCSRDRGVGPCRVALVPSRWRDATCEPRRTDRPVSVIR